MYVTKFIGPVPHIQLHDYMCIHHTHNVIPTDSVYQVTSFWLWERPGNKAMSHHAVY